MGGYGVNIRCRDVACQKDAFYMLFANPIYTPEGPVASMTALEG